MSAVCSKQIKNHTMAVRQCLLMIENTKILVEYKAVSTAEIFKTLSKGDGYRLLPFLAEINKRITNGKDYEKAYTAVLSEKSFIGELDCEDIEYLKGFFSMLGKSDINGQISNCLIYSEFFKKKLNLLESRETERCKTAAALSMGLAAGICVIMI